MPRRRSNQRGGGLPPLPLGGELGVIADLKNPQPRELHLPISRSARKPGRINLKAVSEVLAEKGLDPTQEITKILLGTDDDGNPLLNKDGHAVGSLLDTDTRARVLLELLQYVQPKLKSVEIRARVAATSFDVNDDQAKRIAEEFLKIANGAAVEP